MECRSGVCIVDFGPVSFVEFEGVIADCLDMPLLHLNFLTGVNSYLL